ncbi:MAG: histone deacetylase family protein [Deltaproteobacteria bacterium]|nr:histone deacetylase family protein [Deltaproteobacteria bacterium]
MKIIFHEGFYQVYASDPAAAPGRMEAIVSVIGEKHEFLQAVPAEEADILAVHSDLHAQRVRHEGVYEIAALAAGASIEAAKIGMKEPAFALVRPPGHHASEDSAWGFCYFNNMAIALTHLIRAGLIQKASVLDFDLHYGDGTVNILGTLDQIAIFNPSASDRSHYLRSVEDFLAEQKSDIIGISAGFDNHEADWGGLLLTEDYREMGRMVRMAANAMDLGYFAVLEGGYNHRVLGENVAALLEGMGGE